MFVALGPSGLMEEHVGAHPGTMASDLCSAKSRVNTNVASFSLLLRLQPCSNTSFILTRNHHCRCAAVLPLNRNVSMCPLPNTPPLRLMADSIWAHFISAWFRLISDMTSRCIKLVRSQQKRGPGASLKSRHGQIEWCDVALGSARPTPRRSGCWR